MSDETVKPRFPEKDLEELSGKLREEIIQKVQEMANAGGSEALAVMLYFDRQTSTDANGLGFKFEDKTKVLKPKGEGLFTKIEPRGIEHLRDGIKRPETHLEDLRDWKSGEEIKDFFYAELAIDLSDQSPDGVSREMTLLFSTFDQGVVVRDPIQNTNRYISPKVEEENVVIQDVLS